MNEQSRRAWLQASSDGTPNTSQSGIESPFLAYAASFANEKRMPRTLGGLLRISLILSELEQTYDAGKHKAQEETPRLPCAPGRRFCARLRSRTTDEIERADSALEAFAEFKRKALAGTAFSHANDRGGSNV